MRIRTADSTSLSDLAGSGGLAEAKFCPFWILPATIVMTVASSVRYIECLPECERNFTLGSVCPWFGSKNRGIAANSRLALAFVAASASARDVDADADAVVTGAVVDATVRDPKVSTTNAKIATAPSDTAAISDRVFIEMPELPTAIVSSRENPAY